MFNLKVYELVCLVVTYALLYYIKLLDVRIRCYVLLIFLLFCSSQIVRILYLIRVSCRWYILSCQYLDALHFVEDSFYSYQIHKWPKLGFSVGKLSLLRNVFNPHSEQSISLVSIWIIPLATRSCLVVDFPSLVAVCNYARNQTSRKPFQSLSSYHYSKRRDTSWKVMLCTQWI